MPGISHVQIFENRGEMMGASNPHPHCQIWATRSIPQVPMRELASQHSYLQKHESCLLCDYLELEQAERTRIVCRIEAFMLWCLSGRCGRLKCWFAAVGIWDHCLNSEAKSLFNSPQYCGKSLPPTIACFDVPFPYSMGFHQSPTDGHHPEWHFHAHFYPPLLRSATVRKFMVGFEMLGTPQRDITPEIAAEKLRSLVATT